MKLIISPRRYLGYSGYYLEDIRKELGPVEFAHFEKWFNGQTCAIHEGKPLVYEWDYDRFVAGLPVED